MTRNYIMNVFYLDKNPILSAQYHTDKHVIKMILESAQLLCTAINVAANEQITPYKTTHINHPCSIWTRESYDNFKYVWYLMLELEKEWQFRYNHNKRHKSVESLVYFDLNGKTLLDLAESYLPNIGNTSPPLAMPEHCKISLDPVECYREYYKTEKIPLHKWTNREVPHWI